MAVLIAFLALSFIRMQALHAEEKAKKKSIYLDEEEEQWKGGPAFFESREGVERTPIPSIPDWKEKKPAPLPEGVIKYPEFAADPENPNRDMISKDSWNLPFPKFSYFGLSNRDILWIAAQLHILFASFILGVPIFILISEALGWKTGDPKYERLAKESTKIVAICYSFTALTGGFFALLLITFYPSFMTWLARGFSNLIPKSCNPLYSRPGKPVH